MPLIKKGLKKPEVDSEKAKDQSLAIAYEVQRKNKRKGAKSVAMDSVGPAPEAEGGSVAEAIMRRKSADKDSFNEQNHEAVEMEDIALGDSDPFEGQDDQPMDSNLHGASSEESLESLVDKIRHRIKLKKGI